MNFFSIFLMFFNVIFICQIYEINSREDPYKSADIEKKIKTIDLLNLIMRNVSLVSCLIFIFFDMYAIIPGVLVSGFVMTIATRGKQNARKEVLKITKAIEKKNYEDLEDMV